MMSQSPRFPPTGPPVAPRSVGAGAGQPTTPRGVAATATSTHQQSQQRSPVPLLPLHLNGRSVSVNGGQRSSSHQRTAATISPRPVVVENFAGGDTAGGHLPASSSAHIAHVSPATPPPPAHLLRYVAHHSGKSRDDIPEMEAFFTHGRSNVHTLRNVAVRCIAFVRTGEVWIGERTGSLSRWNAHTCELKQRIERTHRGGALPSCIRQAALHVWIGFHDGTTRVHGVNDVEKALHECKEHAGSITCMETTKDEQFLFTGSSDFIITQFNTSTFARVHALSGHRNAVRCLSMVGIRLFSGGDDSKIIEWEINTNTNSNAGSSSSSLPGKPMHVLTKHHNGSVRALQAATRYLWSAGEDASIRIWSLSPSSEEDDDTSDEDDDMEKQSMMVLPVPSRKPSSPPVCLHIITNPFTSPVTSLKSIGNKMWAVSLSTVYQFDHETFSLSGQFKEHTGALTALDTICESVLSRVWTCGSEGDVKLWNTECNFMSTLSNAMDTHTMNLEHSLGRHFVREEALQLDASLCRSEMERMRQELLDVQSSMARLRRETDAEKHAAAQRVADAIERADALQRENESLKRRLGVPDSGREKRMKLLCEQACRGTILVSDTPPQMSSMDASLEALRLLAAEVETLSMERTIFQAAASSSHESPHDLPSTVKPARRVVECYEPLNNEPPTPVRPSEHILPLESFMSPGANRRDLSDTRSSHHNVVAAAATDSTTTTTSTTTAATKNIITLPSTLNQEDYCIADGAAIRRRLAALATQVEAACNCVVMLDQQATQVQQSLEENAARVRLHDELPHTDGDETTGVSNSHQQQEAATNVDEALRPDSPVFKRTTCRLPSAHSFAVPLPSSSLSLGSASGRTGSRDHLFLALGADDDGSLLGYIHPHELTLEECHALKCMQQHHLAIPSSSVVHQSEEADGSGYAAEIVNFKSLTSQKSESQSSLDYLVVDEGEEGSSRRSSRSLGGMESESDNGSSSPLVGSPDPHDQQQQQEQQDPHRHGQQSSPSPAEKATTSAPVTTTPAAEKQQQQQQRRQQEHPPRQVCCDRWLLPAWDTLSDDEKRTIIQVVERLRSQPRLPSALSNKHESAALSFVRPTASRESSDSDGGVRGTAFLAIIASPPPAGSNGAAAAAANSTITTGVSGFGGLVGTLESQLHLLERQLTLLQERVIARDCAWAEALCVRETAVQRLRSTLLLHNKATTSTSSGKGDGLASGGAASADGLDRLPNSLGSTGQFSIATQQGLDTGVTTSSYSATGDEHEHRRRSYGLLPLSFATTEEVLACMEQLDRVIQQRSREWLTLRDTIRSYNEQFEVIGQESAPVLLAVKETLCSHGGEAFGGGGGSSSAGSSKASSPRLLAASFDEEPPSRTRAGGGEGPSSAEDVALQCRELHEHVMLHVQETLSLRRTLEGTQSALQKSEKKCRDLQRVMNRWAAAAEGYTEQLVKGAGASPDTQDRGVASSDTLVEGDHRHHANESMSISFVTEGSRISEDEEDDKASSKRSRSTTSSESTSEEDDSNSTERGGGVEGRRGSSPKDLNKKNTIQEEKNVHIERLGALARAMASSASSEAQRKMRLQQTVDEVSSQLNDLMSILDRETNLNEAEFLGHNHSSKTSNEVEQQEPEQQDSGDDSSTAVNRLLGCVKSMWSRVQTLSQQCHVHREALRGLGQECKDTLCSVLGEDADNTAQQERSASLGHLLRKVTHCTLEQHGLLCRERKERRSDYSDLLVDMRYWMGCLRRHLPELLQSHFDDTAVIQLAVATEEEDAAAHHRHHEANILPGDREVESSRHFLFTFARRFHELVQEKKKQEDAWSQALQHHSSQWVQDTISWAKRDVEGCSLSLKQIAVDVKGALLQVSSATPYAAASSASSSTAAITAVAVHNKENGDEDGLFFNEIVQDVGRLVTFAVDAQHRLNLHRSGESLIRGKLISSTVDFMRTLQGELLCPESTNAVASSAGEEMPARGSSRSSVIATTDVSAAVGGDDDPLAVLMKQMKQEPKYREYCQDLRLFLSSKHPKEGIETAAVSHGNLEQESDDGQTVAMRSWDPLLRLLLRQHELHVMWTTLLSSFARDQATNFEEKEVRLMRVIHTLTSSSSSGGAAAMGGGISSTSSPPHQQQQQQGGGGSTRAAVSSSSHTGPLLTSDNKAAAAGWFTSTSAGGACASDEIDGYDLSPQTRRRGNVQRRGGEGMMMTSPLSSAKKRSRQQQPAALTIEAIEDAANRKLDCRDDEDTEEDESIPQVTRGGWLSMQHELVQLRQRLALMEKRGSQQNSTVDEVASGDVAAAASADVVREGSAVGSATCSSSSFLIRQILPILEHYRLHLTRGIAFCTPQEHEGGESRVKEEPPLAAAEEGDVICNSSDISFHTDGSSSSSSSADESKQHERNASRKKTNQNKRNTKKNHKREGDDAEEKASSSSGEGTDSDKSLPDEALEEAFTRMRNSILDLEAKHERVVSGHQVTVLQTLKDTLESYILALTHSTPVAHNHDAGGGDSSSFSSGEAALHEALSTLNALSFASVEQRKRAFQSIDDEEERQTSAAQAPATSASASASHVGWQESAALLLQSAVARLLHVELPEALAASQQRVHSAISEAEQNENQRVREQGMALTSLEHSRQLLIKFEMTLRRGIAAAQLSSTTTDAEPDAVLDDNSSLLPVAPAAAAPSTTFEAVKWDDNDDFRSSASSMSFADSGSMTSSFGGAPAQTSEALSQRVEAECEAVDGCVERVRGLIEKSDGCVSNLTVQVLHECNTLAHKYTRLMDQLLHLGSIPPPRRPKLSKRNKPQQKAGDDIQDNDHNNNNQQQQQSPPATADTVTMFRELNQELLQRVVIVEEVVEANKAHLRQLPTFSAWVDILGEDARVFGARLKSIAPPLSGDNVAHRDNEASASSSSPDETPLSTSLRSAHDLFIRQVEESISSLAQKWSQHLEANTQKLQQIQQMWCEDLRIGCEPKAAPPPAASPPATSCEEENVDALSPESGLHRTLSSTSSSNLKPVRKKSAARLAAAMRKPSIYFTGVSSPSMAAASPDAADAISRGKRRASINFLDPQNMTNTTERAASPPARTSASHSVDGLLAVSQAALMTLEATIQNVNSRWESEQESRKSLESRLAAAEEECRSLTVQYDTACGEIALLRDELQDVEANFANVQRTLRQDEERRSMRVDASVATESRVLEVYETMYDHAENARRKLEEQLATLRRDHEQLLLMNTPGIGLLLNNDDEDDDGGVANKGMSPSDDPLHHHTKAKQQHHQDPHPLLHDDMSNTSGDDHHSSSDIAVGPYAHRSTSVLATVGEEVTPATSLSGTAAPVRTPVRQNTPNSRLYTPPKGRGASPSATGPSRSPLHTATSRTPTPTRKQPVESHRGLVSSPSVKRTQDIPLLSGRTRSPPHEKLLLSGFEDGATFAECVSSVDTLSAALDTMALQVQAALTLMYHTSSSASSSNDDGVRDEELRSTAAPLQSSSSSSSQVHHLWTEHSDLVKKYRLAVSNLVERLLFGLRKLQRVSFIVETRPPMLRATWEIYSVLLVSIRTLHAFAKLTDEGRMSRREALGHVDRISDEVASAAEGAAWILSNLFSDDELAHVGASPHLFPPDVKRPTWRDISMSSHFSQVLHALRSIRQEPRSTSDAAAAGATGNDHVPVMSAAIRTASRGSVFTNSPRGVSGVRTSTPPRGVSSSLPPSPRSNARQPSPLHGRQFHVSPKV